MEGGYLIQWRVFNIQCACQSHIRIRFFVFPPIGKKQKTCSQKKFLDAGMGINIV